MLWAGPGFPEIDSAPQPLGASSPDRSRSFGAPSHAADHVQILVLGPEDLHIVAGGRVAMRRPSFVLVVVFVVGAEQVG